MSKDKLTVIVPCKNEEHTVASTVDEVLNTRLPEDIDLQIHLIDDGSTDGTLKAIERICAERDICSVHVNERNLGVGRSVLDAYTRLPANTWATVFPGDGELLFDSLNNHLKIRENHDLILGYLQNPVIRPLGRRLASDGFGSVVNTLYGFPYQYLNGMKLYRVRVFKGIEVLSDGHAFNAELLAKAILRDPRLRIGEAPFLSRGRAHGTSKAFTLSSITKAVSDVYRGHRSVVAYRKSIVSGDEAG